MHVVVTGGAGFIGANTCRALLAEPAVHRVSVIDDLSSGLARNLDGVDVELRKGSILEPDLLEEVFAGCSAVIHLAAIGSVPLSVSDPVASHEVNASGTVRVLEAARRAGGPQVVLASSSSVYGSNPASRKSEDLMCMPLSPYAVSKLALETYALAYAHCYGLPVLPFRFFNVFGPLQPADHAYAAVVPAFVDAALAGRPLQVHGDGLQTRDFTMVDTVTSVLVDAVLRRVTSPTPLNLALGTRSSLLDVILVLEDVLGRPLEVEHTAPRAGDVRDSSADPTRLLAAFPEVQPVGLREGLERTVAWFLERAS